MQLTSLHSRIEGISDADPPQGENDTDETRLLSNDGCYEETNEVAMTTSNTTSIMANSRDKVEGKEEEEVRLGESREEEEERMRGSMEEEVTLSQQRCHSEPAAHLLLLRLCYHWLH